LGSGFLLRIRIAVVMIQLEDLGGV
jgi:hypothetical protein